MFVQLDLFSSELRQLRIRSQNIRDTKYTGSSCTANDYRIMGNFYSGKCLRLWTKYNTFVSAECKSPRPSFLNYSTIDKINSITTKSIYTIIHEYFSVKYTNQNIYMYGVHDWKNSDDKHVFYPKHCYFFCPGLTVQAMDVFWSDNTASGSVILIQLFI